VCLRGSNLPAEEMTAVADAPHSAPPATAAADGELASSVNAGRARSEASPARSLARPARREKEASLESGVARVPQLTRDLAMIAQRFTPAPLRIPEKLSSGPLDSRRSSRLRASPAPRMNGTCSTTRSSGTGRPRCPLKGYIPKPPAIAQDGHHHPICR